MIINKTLLFSNLIKQVLDEPGSAFFYTPPIFKKEKCYLFSNPLKSITGFNFDDLKMLNSLNDEISFGFISYEAGYLIEQKLKHLSKPNNIEPLFNFNIYKRGSIEIFSSKSITHDFDNINYGIENLSFSTTKDMYINSINKIKEFISKGDTYQVNYTIKGSFNLEGSISSLFQSLVFNQSARYMALINNNNQIIISISPELFFRNKKNVLITSPMKGTIKRGINSSEDIKNFDQLLNSEKDKAENVMIVDLLRNDVGKISEFGKVKVTGLFNIEKYESVFQMISTIKTKLKKDILFSDIINNLFPCGSITGAPKLRTMEIINQLENSNRGIYTGAIGIIESNNSIFNVPIRTLTIDKTNNRVDFGVGSGVVWESNAIEEYNETMLKCSFLTSPDKYFEIFTTILIENNTPFLLIKHLKRLQTASEFFLFIYNEKGVVSKIKSICKKVKSNKKYKLKIKINKWGVINTEISEISRINKKWLVKISDKKIEHNKFIFFKTTNRNMYNEELELAENQGCDEVIFKNKEGYITEGSRTNIFIKKNNIWYTPPIKDGLLSGVYREYFLEENGNSIEKSISLNDLTSADEIILVNSVRKRIEVELYYL